jgi:hypothetical protein
MEDLPQLVEAIKEAGCWAFNTEGLKLRVTMPESERKLYHDLSDYMHFNLHSYYRREQKTGSDWELQDKKKMVYINYAQMFATKLDLKYFVADNNMGKVGYGSECCGTEKLRDYRILGCNARTKSFPSVDHTSTHLEKTLVNFCRSKKHVEMTIGEVCEAESNEDAA